MTKTGHHRCYDCRHYSRISIGPHGWDHKCAQRIRLCPLIGPDCHHYDYEPGADRAEALVIEHHHV
ncbi:MAG TPA: hypothetical protein PLW81_06135 [Thiobacillaceae bacterium]|nr:hypothetical protein [Thiobacillaceae bacterium]